MPQKVTDRIKELLKQRDEKIISSTRYLLELLAALKKEVLANLASTPVDSYSAFYLRQSLAGIERHILAFESAAIGELGSGLSSTWSMGSELLPSVLQASGAAVGLSTNHISARTLDTLREFTFGRITNLSRELFGKIKGELTMGILGQKTPQQVAGDIAGMLNGPSIFKTIGERAEVITGLELGRAFSIATQLGMEDAAETLPDLRRMWLHAGHPKMPRQTHLLMHGQVRRVKAPFYQTPEGAKVMYPRDPQAPIKEVIRCGCTHVPFMESWGDAKKFAASWDQTQYQVSFKKAA